MSVHVFLGERGEIRGIVLPELLLAPRQRSVSTEVL